MNQGRSGGKLMIVAALRLRDNGEIIEEKRDVRVLLDT